jgi:hypothetical protein
MDAALRDTLSGQVNKASRYPRPQIQPRQAQARRRLVRGLCEAASPTGPQTITSTTRRPRVWSLRGRNWRGRSLLITLQEAAIALETLENCRWKWESQCPLPANSAATPELARTEPKTPAR